MTNRVASLAMLRSAKSILPPRFIPQGLMTTAPTVSMSSANTNSLSAGRFWRSLTAQNGAGPNTAVYGPFTYGGAGNPVQHTSFPGSVFFPSVSFGGATNFGGGTNGKKFNHATISFYFYGTQFNIAMAGNASASFSLKVDDQYNTLTPVSVPSAANLYYYNVTFAAAAWRRIEIVANSNFLFNGIWTGLTDTIIVDAVRGPRCVFVGDSFVDGTGATNSGASSICQRTFEYLGWNNYVSSGVGGTGFLASSGSSQNYRNRLLTDVIPFAPDVVILQGSTNDIAGAFTSAQMVTECVSAIQMLKTALPNVVVVVTSPAGVNGPTGMTNLSWSHRNALKVAATGSGAFFVDLLERPLPQGYVPLVHTLSSAPSIGGSSFTVSDTPPAIGATYAFDDGSRCLVLTVSGTSAPYTVTVETGGLQSAQTVGTKMTQVGDCPWTGTGRVGATAGDGNSDVLVGNDHFHPTQAGHDMIAQIIAEGIQAVIKAA